MSFRFRLIINNDRFIKWKMELAVTDLLKWGQWRICFFLFFFVNQLIGSWMLLINRSLLTVNYRLVCWTLRLLLNWWLLAEGFRDVDWTDFWLVDRVASLWLLKGGDFRIFGPFFWDLWEIWDLFGVFVGIFKDCRGILQNSCGVLGIFLSLWGIIWIFWGFLWDPNGISWNTLWVLEGFFEIIQDPCGILWDLWVFESFSGICVGFFRIVAGFLGIFAGFFLDF